MTRQQLTDAIEKYRPYNEQGRNGSATDLKLD